MALEDVDPSKNGSAAEACSNETKNDLITPIHFFLVLFVFSSSLASKSTNAGCCMRVMLVNISGCSIGGTVNNYIIVIWGTRLKKRPTPSKKSLVSKAPKLTITTIPMTTL